MKAISEGQLQVAMFMWAYFERNDQLPSCKAIARHFGWSSENAATQVVASLERKGYVERNECGKYRFVRDKKLIYRGAA